MIDVTQLTKEYPGVVAVDDVSFTVERGEIVGFLGVNGAGKSTTMRILTCYIGPTRGGATVAGFDIRSQSMEVRRRVGYLPESNPLYPEMRVGEYLRFRAGIKGVPPGERRRRVDEVTDRCGLSDRRRSIVGNLSKGYRQRVGLADAILHDPELIILDEPTQGLDPNQVRESRSLIRDLGEKRTVMLSTHNLGEVDRVCDRAIIIHRGRIEESGTPDEIKRRFTSTNRVVLVARGDGGKIHETIRMLEGVGSVEWRKGGGSHTFLVTPKEAAEVRPQLFRAASECGWDVLELAHEKVSLEDAFAGLTERPGGKE